MNTDYLLTTGKVAEKNAENFCKKFFIPYKPGTDYSQKLGIDFTYKDGQKWISVDVKNTFDIYLFNIRKDSGMLYIRNPFKKTTKAEEFWIQDKYKNTWFYMGPIKSYMIGKYFSSEKNYELFVGTLRTYDKTRILSPAIDLKKMKENLRRFVKDDVYISYTETKHQFTMSMITYKDNKYVKKEEGLY